MDLRPGAVWYRLISESPWVIWRDAINLILKSCWCLSWWINWNWCISLEQLMLMVIGRRIGYTLPLIWMSPWINSRWLEINLVVPCRRASPLIYMDKSLACWCLLRIIAPLIMIWGMRSTPIAATIGCLWIVHVPNVWSTPFLLNLPVTDFSIHFLFLFYFNYEKNM